MGYNTLLAMQPFAQQQVTYRNFVFIEDVAMDVSILSYVVGNVGR